MKSINERFEFRDILDSEAEEANEIEQICFPPHEACTRERILERAAAAPELFMVAIDRQSGKIAGFLNGVSTDETKFRDEFFTDISLYKPDGQSVMLVGLDVLPEYRMQGLARAIVDEYIRRERKKERKYLFLTCLDEKVKMYEKFGFIDKGIADSTWGGEQWHEMVYNIK